MVDSGNEAGDDITPATPKLAPSGSDLSKTQSDLALRVGPTDPALAVANGISQIKTALSTFQHLNEADNICETRLLIGKLVKDTLAKLNQASEIYHSSGPTDPALADGISQIKTAISKLQHLVNTIGTLNDAESIPENICRTRLYIGKLVKDTLAKLNQASEIYHDTEVLLASQKNADYKLGKDFQAVLKEFQEAQQLANEEGPFAPNQFFSGVDWLGQSNEDASQTMIAGHEEARRFAIDFDERRQEGLQKVQKHIVRANQIMKHVCDLVHELVGTINSIGHKPRRSNSFPSYLPLVMVGIVPVAVGIVFAARRGMFW